MVSREQQRRDRPVLTIHPPEDEHTGEGSGRRRVAWELADLGKAAGGLADALEFASKTARRAGRPDHPGRLLAWLRRAAPRCCAALNVVIEALAEPTKENK